MTLPTQFPRFQIHLSRCCILLGLFVSSGAGAETVFGPPASLQTGENPKALVASDFNNDGNADLAAGRPGAIDLFPGGGNGTFGPRSEIPLDPTPAAMAPEDFNGDGLMDLASAGATSVSVVLNRGNLAFRPAPSLSVNFLSRGLAADDFNGDGRADLALLTTCASCYNGGPDFAVLLYPGKGDGSFGDPATFPIAVPWAFPLPSGADLTGDLTAADLNGDGRADLVASVGFSQEEEVVGPCREGR